MPRIRPVTLLLLLWALCLADGAFAQYFARNSVQLPSLGWMAMDSTFGFANKVQWGMNDQVQIGTGFARDLVDLKLWWVSESAVGFGQVNLPGVPTSRIAVTVQGSTGLKYNFYTERWRPFAGFMLEVFQVFNSQAEAYFPYVLATPTWAAFRPMVGLEWIFESDMSLELQTGYILLLNFEDPVRHSFMVRAAYRIYF
jgi:hypothetical protein